MTLILWAATAHAISSFPALVKDHLVMDCAPACTLCHTSPAGGAGTATEPFAVALSTEGLLVSDEASLGVALDAVQAAGATYDANADGVNDVDELTVGENPNPDGTDFCPADGDAPPELLRGCVAQADGSAAAAAGIALMALARGRRKRA